MRTLRRIAIALGIAALLGGLLRLRGRGGKPPSGTGWRELDIPAAPR